MKLSNARSILGASFIPVVCLALSACSTGSLRILAISTVAALDIYSTIAIQEATTEELAEIKAMLESIKPYTDQAAAGVDAKLALIASLEGE